jgi:hypothetical protein
VEEEMNEHDPTGLLPSDPGAKLDAGKPMVGSVLSLFSNALLDVAKVGTYGATKYSMGGWQHVDNGVERYEDAQMRHWIKRHSGEEYDGDTHLRHAAHEAWNALAKLELMIREQQEF